MPHKYTILAGGRPALSITAPTALHALSEYAVACGADPHGFLCKAAAPHLAYAIAEISGRAAVLVAYRERTNIAGELLRKRAPALGTRAKQTRPLPPSITIHLYGADHTFPLTEREAIRTVLHYARFGLSERPNNNLPTESATP